MTLEARSLLLQFLRDADEEMAWVQEKLPLVASRDCSQSLSALRHLQEKHQVWPQGGEGLFLGAGSSLPPGGLCGSPEFLVSHKDRVLFRGGSVGPHNTSEGTLGPPRITQEHPPSESPILFSFGSAEPGE